MKEEIQSWLILFIIVYLSHLSSYNPNPNADPIDVADDNAD